MSIILIDEEKDLQIIDSDQQQQRELRASLQEQATMHLIRTLNESPYDCKLKHSKTKIKTEACVCTIYFYRYIVHSHS